MKKAYNQNWIENLEILDTASYWLSKNLITTEQLSKIKKDFPEHFYRPGIFVKIGLFFFALIACSFFVGFISLFFIDGDNLVVVNLICLPAFGIFLEYLIKKRNLFHSGVDNALLYSAIGAALTPFFILFNNLEIWQYCIFMLIVFSVTTVRYADFLAAISLFAVLFTLLANMMMKFPLGKSLLPFAIMLLAAMVYFSAKKIADVYYHNCRKLWEVLSLVMFYFGGNYLVVREGNALLNELNLPVSPQVSFAPVFYFFTLITPLAYIGFGLRKKDRILFIVGLLTFAFSIYTYRHYFSSLTPAQELVIAGIFLVIIAATLVRYLHVAKHGLTDEPDRKRKFANLEALIIAQNMGQVPQQGNVEFGSGDFGGGGAGEVY